MANSNGDVTFNVTKSIWRLNHAANGWQKEVNLVAWNSNKPRLDIRDWNSDKTKMKKGITLTKDEAFELRKCLSSIDLEYLYDDVNAGTEVSAGPGPCGSGIPYVIAAPQSAVQKAPQEEHESEGEIEIESEAGNEAAAVAVSEDEDVPVPF